jgi:transcription elongation factor Elf1
MGPDHKVLNAQEWERGHKVITTWKNDPEADLTCPRCGQGGLQLVDQSARPYSEWYELSCETCGLEVAMHLPQAPPMQTPV